MDRGRIARSTDFPHRVGVAQYPGDPGQRLQMIGASAFRRDGEGPVALFPKPLDMDAVLAELRRLLPAAGGG